MMRRLIGPSLHVLVYRCLALLMLIAMLGAFLPSHLLAVQAAHNVPIKEKTSITIERVFTQASRKYTVPIALLEAFCYMEGRLSNNNGVVSVDGGYGCMHLVNNQNADTLDRAAKDLAVSPLLLKTDLATNILGGAAVLHATALQLSSTHTLPTSLADWYTPVAAYSAAATPEIADMYADNVYALLNSGFRATAQTGEVITLPAQYVQPHKETTSLTNAASAIGARAQKAPTGLPPGCKNDGKTDYPGAIDCIVATPRYDCNRVPTNAPCTFEGANRPADFPVDFVAIHDIEGSALDGINVMHNVNSGVSIHYIVDTNGTVYQLLHDKDIGYHVGNYWYNQRAVGIEHAGYAASGYQWYNSQEYQASARLTAYLVKKYHIPLDRQHIVAHGTVPSPALSLMPNHVDPGPYWLWDYYFTLIEQQSVASIGGSTKYPIITLRPTSDSRPFGASGMETGGNFSFFYLYNGPNTRSGLIVHAEANDILDETDNAEAGMSYLYIAKKPDQAGSGDMMYEIWYGEQVHLSDKKPSQEASARLAWLAVPPGGAVVGSGGYLSFKPHMSIKIYGRPDADAGYQIGDAPNSAAFASEFILPIADDGNTWYEINFNHRQAWVPATEATVKW